MIASSVRQRILDAIKEATGSSISSLQFFPVGGGSINHTYEIKADTGQQFFAKVNELSKFPGLFEAEKQGLELLQAQNLVRIPRIAVSTAIGDTQVLVLEWIEQGTRSADFWSLFGQQLAALHSVKNALCGLPADNYMGSLPQYNAQEKDWNKFFINQRLEPQVRLAVDRGLLPVKEAGQFAKLYIRLNTIFEPVEPCLLHGDLWSGNFLCDDNSRPVLIDPAVYFGHPSIDLGMTTLFGGFDKSFYESYHHGKPFAPNYREQWEICNLYPLLIHLNLFGESYRSAILHTIHRY